MRLTLRALLAYLYNVLEPADASDFSAKVQESAVASGLVQRIQGITKKMRMNAPRIDAKGTADDANNVAEYLDNSLAEEQVADFERACINSDMHLAEVASSYQILTMVLGKAAEYPDSLQTRVYRLPLDLATTHKDDSGDPGQRKRLKKTMEKVAQSARETDSGMQSVRTGSTHPVAEVPDYLRTKPGSLAKWLAIAVVLLLIAALVITAAGPWDASNGVIGWLFAPADVADADGTGSSDDDQTAARSLPGVSADDKGDDAGDDAEKTADKSADNGKKPAKNGADEAPSADSASKSVADAADASPGPPVPPVEPDEATSATASDATGTKGKAKVEKTTADEPAKAAIPPDPMDVGRFVSDDQVLSRFDRGAEMWFLVSPRSILSSGERLVVFPTYRPQVALASGVQVTFAGESEVQLLEPKNAAASRLQVDYGRFLVVTPGTAGAQLEIEFGEVQGTLTLADTDTVVAIDARHFLPPGSTLEDEKDERIAVLEIYAAAGQIRWEESGIDPVDIPSQHVLTYVAGSDRELAGPIASPDWIDAINVSHIDRLTSPTLQRELSPDKPVHIQLQELMMTDRRAEVRALAARCLAQLGEFEPVVRELSSAQQKSFWAAEVEILRQSLARGSEAQARIRQSLESLYPGDAATLLRLLVGFSPEQLEAGADAELVQFLESPEMAVRVLAIDTLRQITGAQLLYRPEKAPAENRGPILKWSERAKEETIAYKTSPSPIGERKARTPLPPAPAEDTKAPAKEKEE